MFKFNPTTAMKFYCASTSYVQGQGPATVWQPIVQDTLYGEWKGAYGERAMSAEALGIKDSATIRTFYNPDVYQKIKTVKVVVAKNADSAALAGGVPDKNNVNVYEVWGGVDNVLEENQFMEFKVRRYEGL